MSAGRRENAYTLVESASHLNIHKSGCLLFRTHSQARYRLKNKHNLNCANIQTSAFTLAEVLITLGIIGIVAAMTLPSIVQKNRNKQLEAGLKRSYSLIAQALDMYQAQNGERLKPDNVGGVQKLKPAIIKYFHVVRDCGTGSEGNAQLVEKSCIPNYVNVGTTNKNSTKYKTLNGKTNIMLDRFDDGQFVLNDGSLILLENANFGHLFISVDVNGYNKNPNRLGQDLFMFQIDTKGTLLPMGVEGTVYYSKTDDLCSATSTNNLNGAGCTYKALTDKNYFNDLPK